MDFNIGKMLNHILAKHDMDDPDPLGNMPNLPPEPPTPAREDPALLAEFQHLETTELNPDQQRFFDLLMASPWGLHCLSGAPGSGKSFMPQYITHMLRKKQKVVLLSAMTGTAAVRLSAYANTAHHNLYIPVSRSDWWQDLSPSHPLFTVINEADVIIIDEFSMMKGSFLNSVIRRLRQVHGTGHTDIQPDGDVFTNKLLLLVGDHAQLPPVCNSHGTPKNEVCMQCHITKSPFWPAFQLHHLPMSVRHLEDPPVSVFLDHVRVDPPTSQAHIDAIPTSTPSRGSRAHAPSSPRMS